MRILDVLNSPWAIQQDKLIEIREIYQTHLRGDKIDFNAIEARIGKPLNNETQSVTSFKGVAVIELHGVVAKRLNLFSRISGGTSTEIFSDQVKKAANDDDIDSIVLSIDGPGGTVDGTFEAADVVFQARENKPIVAFVDGLAASASYAIASAAERVFISGPAAIAGSIGVVATHVDVSSFEKSTGIKTTEITAGRFKRSASQFEPLSKEGRADIQAQVDFLYTVFVEKVALYRGVSVETVLEDMADGRLFIGQQAIDANLVDGFSTLDALVEQLGNGVLPSNISTAVLSDIEVNRVTTKLVQDDIEMSKDTITKGYILENHPEVAESLRQDGINSVDTSNIKAEAKQTERDRIKGVNDQSVAGHEKLITELMFDGKTDAGMAAVQILKADKENRVEKSQQLETDAPAPIPHADIPKTNTKTTTIDPNAPIEERCKAAWNSDASLRTEFSNDFDAYLEGERAMEDGQVKVLGK